MPRRSDAAAGAGMAAPVTAATSKPRTLRRFIAPPLFFRFGGEPTSDKAQQLRPSAHFAYVSMFRSRYITQPPRPAARPPPCANSPADSNRPAYGQRVAVSLVTRGRHN